MQFEVESRMGFVIVCCIKIGKLDRKKCPVERRKHELLFLAFHYSRSEHEEPSFEQDLLNSAYGNLFRNSGCFKTV